MKEVLYALAACAFMLLSYTVKKYIKKILKNENKQRGVGNDKNNIEN